MTAQMENLVNSIYALQVTLQGFVLIQMIVTDVDKAASVKPGDYMVERFSFIIGKGQFFFGMFFLLFQLFCKTSQSVERKKLSGSIIFQRIHLTFLCYGLHSPAL